MYKFISKQFFNFNYKSFCIYKSKKDDIFTISLIGRTNVGKSTLFNKLLGERESLVDNTPGLTRDRKEAYLKLFGIKMRLVDTAGIDDFEEKQSYEELVNKTISQTRQALLYSDLAFFIIDAKAGITHIDIKLSRWLHSLSKNNKSTDNFYENLKNIRDNNDIKIPKIILVANKTENEYVASDVYNEYNKLKFDEPIYISAEHGDNMNDIYKIIEENISESVKENYLQKVDKRLKRYNEYKERFKNEFIENLNKLPEGEKEKYSLSDWEKDFDYINKFDIEENSDYDSDNDIDPIDNLTTTKESNQKKNSELFRSRKPIKVAVIGRQNAGKSSIINCLMKENRVIISDIPGTTRDSIQIEWLFKGRRIILIDTAGLKGKDKTHDKIEKMTSAATIQAINFCHVVLYVIDSMTAFNVVDLKLINYIGEQGRAMVFIANKWDLVSNGYKTKAKKWMEDQLENGCNEYKGARINFVSAKNLYKIDDIMDTVLNCYSSWNSRVKTNVLNEWVNQIKKVTNTPGKDGGHLKLKFITQIKTRPPAFTVFVNDIDLFFKSHETFMKKMMCKEFGMRNTPIRFLLRDHKKIQMNNKFKKVSIAAAKIQKKIRLLKDKLSKPTYRRKVKGYEKLYGNKSIYKGYKK